MTDIGGTLRDARVRRGMTVDQVAQDTRISPRFIAALEANSFDELPAPVYVRGFLRSYANYLRLDPAPLMAELATVMRSPVSGPEDFVSGPAGPAQPRGPRDPFRASNPPTVGSAPPLPPLPPRPPAPPGDGTPFDDDGWDDDGEPAAYVPAAPPYRPSRVAGVLVERDEPVGTPSGARTVLLAGLAVVVVIAVALVAVLLSGGGGDDNVPAADGGATATSGPRTVVPVGSPTAKATGSPSATVSGTPSTATVTGTPPTKTPTNTVGPGTPTPTQLPTETPTPTALATSTPTSAPTATPFPPTSTPTAVPTMQPHPYGLAECTNLGAGIYDCGAAPIRVICAPDDWFVDVGWDYPKPPEWPQHEVNYPGEALKACPAV
ncbi:MAG: helix-turn-helix domain-containing protein [Chloroflexi bacterium]|nr:helix-turn-helix domain-containing protein [Chloroflexota bacterium]